MIKIIKKEKIACTYTVNIGGRSFVFDDLETAKYRIKLHRLATFLVDNSRLSGIDALDSAEEMLENEAELRYILDSVGVEVVE